MRSLPALLLFLSGISLSRAQTAPSSAAPGDAYDAAKELFDAYAPPEVKAQYRFPSREEAQAALQQIQQALSTGSLDDLARYADQARDLLPVLRAIPGLEDYADWLASHLDEMEAAKSLRRAPAPPAAVPFYGDWVARLRGRPPPAAARELMPRLRAAFTAEGVPPQIAWLAEAESSLNPSAESPVGARGLFQLMPETAKRLGLSTFLPDERRDPDKSAHAAARDLRALGRRFHSWPLAFAAYNAGEGRVSRLLAARHARAYGEIAAALPGETRLYVPKVCALIALRTGAAPDQLPLP